MIKLISIDVRDQVMWVREDSVTAITKVPQGYPKGVVYWNIHGAGWSAMVADLPTQLKWMVN